MGLRGGLALTRLAQIIIRPSCATVTNAHDRLHAAVLASDVQVARRAGLGIGVLFLALSSITPSTMSLKAVQMADERMAFGLVEINITLDGDVACGGGGTKTG
jgi:hypothetical protein